MVDKVKCPECGSLKTWKKGQVPSRSGPKTRYVCFTCGRTFYKPKETPKPKTRKARASKKKS